VLALALVVEASLVLAPDAAASLTALVLIWKLKYEDGE
jgi:hypothetical protein